METRLQLLKRANRFFKNTFSDRKDEWQRQSEFISALAEANDIYFDASEFPKPRRHLRHGRIVWGQSMAAEYISGQIYLKMLRDEYIFRPWNAAWLPVRKEGMYERFPFYHVPIMDTLKLRAEQGKIWVFIFSDHKRQEDWIALENYNYIAICKDCMHKWEHYSLKYLIENKLENPDDIVFVPTQGGASEREFKCPKCGGRRIYKDAHFGNEKSILSEK